MQVGEAFKDFQKIVNADDDAVKEARRRRDLFKGAFSSEADVVEVVPSGSLARGTQHDPIHDVDTIIVFRQEDHPDWGNAGSSAKDALSELGSRVNKLLGQTNGTYDQLVRLADPRDHAVKCFIDDPDDEDPFTVDAMPALRHDDGTLLIPECHSEMWIPANPEHLIALTSKAHKDWNSFAPMVRVLKRWRRTCGTPVKSLVMEVLALDHLPREGERADALSKFFVAAAVGVISGVQDPAGLCGDIQPDLDVYALSDALDAAGETAAEAMAAAQDDEPHAAIRLWGKVFPDFPEPPEGGGGSGGGGTGSGSGSGGSGDGGAAAPAVGAAAAATLLRPRPVRDAPQG